jgi:hypothetical protein
MTATPASTNNAPEPSASVSRHIARERVRAMEALAGAIAHEIRAAVLGVTSAAQLLRYSLPQDPVAEKSLGRILQESERLSALHESLTEYATEVPPRFVPGDPDETWRAVIANMRGALEASSVTLTHASAGSRTRCSVDPAQLSRALERIVHYALGRVNSGSALDVVSSVDDDRTWSSTISISPDAPMNARPSGEFERPTFVLALAHRTLVAHGGDVTEHHGDDPSLLVSLRLPLSPPSE